MTTTWREIRGSTMAEISISIENKYFWGDNNIIANFNIICTMYKIMRFYVFKMAMAIAFLCENAVKAI